MTDEASDAKKITPFKMISRGEDSVDREDDIIFADFSPRIVPADTPEEPVVVPKDEYAPAPAPSLESTEKTEPLKSDKPAPAPASKDDGKVSPAGNGKQDSSSPKKSG